MRRSGHVVMRRFLSRRVLGEFVADDVTVTAPDKELPVEVGV